MATDRGVLNDYIAENKSLLLRLGDREKEILELKKANTELADLVRKLRTALDKADLLLSEVQRNGGQCTNSH